MLLSEYQYGFEHLTDNFFKQWQNIEKTVILFINTTKGRNDEYINKARS